LGGKVDIDTRGGTGRIEGGLSGGSGYMVAGLVWIVIRI